MPTASSERPRRRHLIALLVGGLLAMLVPSASLAQGGNSDPGSGGDYVTTTTPAQRSIDVSAFSPECIGTAPYIRYTVVPLGFTPTSQTVEMVFRDRSGTVIETRTVDGLTGTTIFPGAQIDESGNAIDWPGWTRAEDGSWIPDPTDAGVRDGLTVDVTVDGITATAQVAYPAAGTPCDGPVIDECVPGQNNDGNPDDDCDLATTGGDGRTLLLVAAAALVGGLALVIGAQLRRRHRVPAPPPAT